MQKGSAVRNLRRGATRNEPIGVLLQVAKKGRGESSQRMPDGVVAPRRGAPSSVQRRPVERSHCRLSGARRALTGEARAGTGEAAGQVAVENARDNGSGGARKPVARWATKRGRILALGRIIGETGVDHREAARMGRRRDWRGSESRCGALMLAWAAS